MTTAQPEKNPAAVATELATLLEGLDCQEQLRDCLRIVDPASLLVKVKSINIRPKRANMEINSLQLNGKIYLQNIFINCK